MLLRNRRVPILRAQEEEAPLIADHEVKRAEEVQEPEETCRRLTNHVVIRGHEMPLF